MSSDSEFEMTQHTLVGHSPSSPKRRKTSLHPLPNTTSIDIPALFAPGGSLDSQTTDSQWAEIHCEAQSPESQPLEGLGLGDSTMGFSQQPEDFGSQSEPPEDHYSQCHPAQCGDEYLISQVINIIDLCTTNAIYNLDLPKKEKEIKHLHERCTILEGQIHPVEVNQNVVLNLVHGPVAHASRLLLLWEHHAHLVLEPYLVPIHAQQMVLFLNQSML
ncbi:hypothetical protein BJ912DRAFT_923159 [Pholiota molesta]|nr:hypothetical protein BJ912DRAFT_923159 [Pholiota molesta]